MRLVEFKVKKVDEGILDTLIGQPAATGIRQVGNKILGRPEASLSVRDKMAKDTFIKDLTSKLSTALDTAIRSKLVDPMLSTKKVNPNPVTEKELNEAITINKFVSDWIQNYLGNINFNDPSVKKSINGIIQNVGNTYSSDKGKAAIQQLADMAYALASRGSSAGSATQQAKQSRPATTSATPAAPTTPAAEKPAGTTPKLTVAQINAAIPTLRTRDLQSVKKQVDAAIAKKGSTGTANTQQSISGQSNVGTPSSTGGATFTSPGVTRHTAASGREATQQQARNSAAAARQARATAQANTRPRLAAVKK